MDRQTALQSYIQAILPEREAWLYQRALNKARPITRGMTPAEAEEYLGGKAFASALYHVRRADSAYQALKRGELALDFHQAEFERLEPLIEAELRRGSEIDLDFLRSVERSRVPLKRAREALRRLEEGAPRRLLEGRRKRLIAESEGKVQRWLQKADLSRLARRDPPAEQVVADLMKQTFEKGVPPAIVEQAWQPWSLAAALRGAIDDAFPELSTCSLVVAPSGRTVTFMRTRDGSPCSPGGAQRTVPVCFCFYFDVEGSARKALAYAIGESIGAYPSYKAAPSFVYTIGEYSLDRHGVLTGPQNQQLLATLEQDGYRTK